MNGEQKPCYPVFLRLQGRICLVVGGGRVAWRKITGLLQSGARVRVVAPETAPEVAAAAAAGELEHLPREFRDGDLDGAFLVYAATSSAAANREVLAGARRRGILAAAVDGSWREGDFVTPARFAAEGATIAVSTDGRSCTRARDLKNRLRQLLAANGKREDEEEADAG